MTAPRTYPVSRRIALMAGLGVATAGAVAAGGYGLIETGTLPGKYRVARLLGACGSPPAPPRGPLPTRQQTQFWSAYRQRQVTMVTLIPAGISSARGLGVIVALHGLGGDAAGTAGSVALGMAAADAPRAGAGTAAAAASAAGAATAAEADAAGAGPGGFAVVTVDGGTTYWHRRADGDDPQGMIIHELLPRLAALGMRTGRIGIIGQSMGGYGALLLAERLGGTGAQPAAAAVAAVSPAIFASFADARQADRRAFDGPEDFAHHDVFSGLAALRRVPAYVACGSSDPFEPMARAFRARLQRLTGQAPGGAIAAGCHDYDFWARNLPPALTFIGSLLP